MNFKAEIKEIERIKLLPEEQRKQSLNDFRLKQILDFGKPYLDEKRRRVFWEVIHNIRDLIMFFMLLPFAPIVYIIQAIRGDL